MIWVKRDSRKLLLSASERRNSTEMLGLPTSGRMIQPSWHPTLGSVSGCKIRTRLLRPAEKAEKRRRRYERLGITDPGKSGNKPIPTPAVDPNKYNTPEGSIVRVDYEGGTTFILNYNSYDVTVEYEGQTYEIEAMGFAKIG